MHTHTHIPKLVADRTTSPKAQYLNGTTERIVSRVVGRHRQAVAAPRPQVELDAGAFDVAQHLIARADKQVARDAALHLRLLLLLLGATQCFSVRPPVQHHKQHHTACVLLSVDAAELRHFALATLE